jgi:hypothetical protein
LIGLSVLTGLWDGPVVENILNSMDRLMIGLVIMCTCRYGERSVWVFGAVADRGLDETQVRVILIGPVKNLYRACNLTMHGDEVKINLEDEHENCVWAGAFSPAGTIFRY